MTTESIETKYNFGADEGKYELIRTVFNYGFIGVIIGAIVQVGIKTFRHSPGVAASAGKMAYD